MRFGNSKRYSFVGELSFMKTNKALLEIPFRVLLTELVTDAELEADIQGLSGSEKATFVVEYIKGFMIQE